MKKKIDYLVSIIYKCYQKIIRMVYAKHYDSISKDVNKIKVQSINDTIFVLKNSNKSISRFGDGEFSWMFGHNKYGSFEKPSKLLRKRLLQVFTSDNPELIIGLPGAFRDMNLLTPHVVHFWEGVISKYWRGLSKYLSSDEMYFNANISRCYMDYKNKKGSRYIFHNLKEIWNNKKILIIEGNYSRLGVNNDLFSNTRCIRRIECPPVNAFEHYQDILRISNKFLSNHNDFMALLSLGPTATVLAYDLSNLGYRAIDIGQIDLEYDWFLKGAKKKINIPIKYVNSYRIKNGMRVAPIHDEKYNSEVYCYVK